MYFQIVRVEHVEGNGLIKKEEYKGAARRYTRGIRLLEDVELRNDQDEKQQKHLVFKLYLNRSYCFIKVHMPKKACLDLQKALEMQPYNAKALYRMGEQAKWDLSTCLSVNPGHSRHCQASVGQLLRRQELPPPREPGLPGRHRHRQRAGQPGRDDEEAGAEREGAMQKNVPWRTGGRAIGSIIALKFRELFFFVLQMPRTERNPGEEVDDETRSEMMEQIKG